MQGRPCDKQYTGGVQVPLWACLLHCVQILTFYEDQLVYTVTASAGNTTQILTRKSSLKTDFFTA